MKNNEWHNQFSSSLSGKSSLARALLGIEHSQGEIIFDKKNINTLNSNETRKFKKDFQIVFQDPFGSLSPRMTIGEIVGEGLKVHQPNLNLEKEKFEEVCFKIKSNLD